MWAGEGDFGAIACCLAATGSSLGGEALIWLRAVITLWMRVIIPEDNPMSSESFIQSG